ncbi:hypothetical protein VTK73DRAFT_1734 [Phialemonium thermophilum]|uniref:Uncharacterized protein n=1 Tax=Phialemonium thermophilum TaxID=223376 RepID=A0ABR3VT28_9PEZI
MLWFTMMMMPTGPPAMKLIAMVEASGAEKEDESSIAKLLTPLSNPLRKPQADAGGRCRTWSLRFCPSRWSAACGPARPPWEAEHAMQGTDAIDAFRWRTHFTVLVASPEWHCMIFRRTDAFRSWNKSYPVSASTRAVILCNGMSSRKQRLADKPREMLIMSAPFIRLYSMPLSTRDFDSPLAAGPDDRLALHLAKILRSTQNPKIESSGAPNTARVSMLSKRLDGLPAQFGQTGTLLRCESLSVLLRRAQF